jgi:hypothetical protein
MKKLFVNIFKSIKHGLTTSQNEPQVEQKRDRFGNFYWQVYDYQTNKSYTFGCDREVRSWIEERYHTTHSI